MCSFVLRWLIRILDNLKCHDQKHKRITVKITVSLCLHFFQVHPNGIRKWDGSLRHRGSSFVCAGNCAHDFKQVGPLDSGSKAPRYLMEFVRASECACGLKRGRYDEGELLMCTGD
jgi:hypothetical protein